MSSPGDKNLLAESEIKATEDEHHHVLYRVVKQRKVYKMQIQFRDCLVHPDLGVFVVNCLHFGVIQTLHIGLSSETSSQTRMICTVQFAIGRKETIYIYLRDIPILPRLTHPPSSPHGMSRGLAYISTPSGTEEACV